MSHLTRPKSATRSASSSVVDPKLRELVEHASEFAERQFRKKGAVHPMWIALDRDGRRIVAPPPVPFGDQASKDFAVAAVRTLFELTGVESYVFVSEAWIVMSADGAGLDPEAARRHGVSRHPDRREAVIFTAESELGLVVGRREIVRPAGARARLGPLVLERHDRVEGRMASMLPRTGATS